MNLNSMIRMPKSERLDKGYYPNEVYKDDDSVVIVAHRGDHGDFSLNEKCLRKAASLTGYETKVVLARKDTGENISEFSVNRIFKRLKHEPTEKGRFGNFWWITKEGELCKKKKFAI